MALGKMSDKVEVVIIDQYMIVAVSAAHYIQLGYVSVTLDPLICYICVYIGSGLELRRGNFIPSIPSFQFF